MENRRKKRNGLGKVLRCAWSEYIGWLINPRVAVFFAMLFFIYQFAAQSMIEHAEKMGQPLGVFDIFIAVGNSYQMMAIMPSVFLLLIGDCPKNDGNMFLYVARAGRYHWFLGQVLMGIMAAVTFIGTVFLACFMMGAGHAEYSGGWSSVVTEYHLLYPDDAQNLTSSFITGRLYNNFTPNEALFYTITLLFAMLVFLYLLKLICFLGGNPMAGLPAGITLIGVGCALMLLDIKIKWLFPMAHALEWQHCDEVLKTMEVSMTQSYLYFAVWILVLFTAGVMLVERYNFTKKE